MRKNIFGKQLGRDINERKALFKTLSSSLVMVERIRTTEQKAKAIKPYVEKLVTKARKNGVMAARVLHPYLAKDAVEKMVNDIVPRFADRPGGYTRIIHAGNRPADDAPMVIMEWVEKTNVVSVVGPKKTSVNTKEKKVKTVTGRKQETAVSVKKSAVGKKVKSVKKDK